jgi:hypothetical protein
MDTKTNYENVLKELSELFNLIRLNKIINPHNNYYFIDFL